MEKPPQPVASDLAGKKLLEALVGDVERQQGRNLRLFQQFEAELKLLVTLCKLEGSLSTLPSTLEKRIAKWSKAQIGKLVEEYKTQVLADHRPPATNTEPAASALPWVSFAFRIDGVASPNSVQRDAIDRVLLERNAFIHPAPLPIRTSTEAVAAELAGLLDQYGRCLPVVQELSDQRRLLVQCRADIGEFANSKSAQVGLELSWLQLSTVVAAAEDVATRRARPDGWAFLSDAQCLAQKRDPDAMSDLAARYGHETFEALLAASEMFDMKAEPRPRGGIRTLIRLRPIPQVEQFMLARLQAAGPLILSGSKP